MYLVTQFNGCLKVTLGVLLILFGIFHIAYLLNAIENDWLNTGIMIGLSIFAYAFSQLILRWRWKASETYFRGERLE